MFMVAVVGGKKSGKTTAVEILIRGLTERGYKVATFKHIPETDFTIDTTGKDTWRHAKAGARTIISVAPNELAVIRKVETAKYSLEQLVAECKDYVEIIVLEGFKKLIGHNLAVPKIVAVKKIDEVLEASEHYRPILTFVGPIHIEGAKPKIRYVDALKEPEKLVNLVAQKAAILVERKRGDKEKLQLQLDERVLSLNPFVKKILRNTILGMISTLRGITIRGDEKISIIIKLFSGRK